MQALSFPYSKTQELMNVCTAFNLQMIQAGAGIQDSVTTFLNDINNILESVAIACFLYSEEKQALQIVAQHGFNPEYIEKSNYALIHSEQAKLAPAYRVFETGESMCVTGLINTNYEWFSDYARKVQVNTLYGAPIFFEDKVQGCFIVYHPGTKELSATDVELWTRLVAQQIGVAIHQYRLNIKLQAALEEQKEIDRYKDEFLSAITHELRTPLAIIRGNAEFLEDGFGGVLSETQNEFVQSINSSVHNMMSLIDDLLDTARIKAGKFAVNRNVVNYTQLIEETYKTTKILFDAKEINYILSVEDDVGLITLDSNRIRQVIYNLLSNAAKFSHEKGTVILRVTKTKDCVRTLVVDEGIGLKEEQVARLFTTFYRADNRLNRSTNGTGLGLVLAKGLVEAHEGKIGVFSEYGRGSIFYFDLPLKNESTI